MVPRFGLWFLHIEDEEQHWSLQRLPVPGVAPSLERTLTKRRDEISSLVAERQRRRKEEDPALGGSSSGWVQVKFNLTRTIRLRIP